MRDFSHFLALVAVKVRLDLRSEASKMRLSYTWWLLEPLLHLGVFYVVFGILLRRGGENFVPFLLCGITPWLWFAKSIANSSQSIIGGRGLISQTYIPKIFFPLVIISQDLFKQLFVFVLLLAFLVFYGYSPSGHWLWIIPIVITQFAFIAGASFMVAFAIPFALDLRFVVRTLLTLGMLGSGIFYSYEQVLIPAHRELFLSNPMANLIVNYRAVLMDGETPRLASLSWIMALSVGLIVLAYLLMRRYDNHLTRLIVE